MTTQSTTNYDIFKFRNDNRARVQNAHVLRLKQSIQSRNLLAMRPITVNEEMEVVDGQHRLMAAKALGVPVYFTVEKDFNIEDIILMNTAKSWGIHDYLNFYVKNHFPEYMKLDEYMKKTGLGLKIALYICMGTSHDERMDFRQGRFKFVEETEMKEIDECWQTVGYIKKINGAAAYYTASKFWNALLKLIRHPNFDRDKWYSNLKKLVDRCEAKVSTKDYLKMLSTIYNYNNRNERINFIDEEE